VQELIASVGDLPGCVLTLDALHAVHKTFEMAVVDCRADYLVCVKGNAEDLRRTAERILEHNSGQVQRARTVDKGHGRIETRDIEMAPATPVQTGWPHTHTVCRVTRQRETRRRGQTIDNSREQVYYVASFPATTYTAAQVLKLVRGHWSIENGLHHRKDRSMDEDRNRASRKGCARVMCCIRSISALVLGRARETISVVQRRLSGKAHLLLGLLSCRSVHEWERLYKPYLLA
jgi:predicted transposase YbfD/YdcC